MNRGTLITFGTTPGLLVDIRVRADARVPDGGTILFYGLLYYVACLGWGYIYAFLGPKVAQLLLPELASEKRR